MRQFAKDIIRSLAENPEDWFCGITFSDGGKLYDYEQHKEPFHLSNGAVSLWVANGTFWLEVESPKMGRLGFFERYRIWKAYQHWLKATDALAAFKEAPTNTQALEDAMQPIRKKLRGEP